MMRTFFLLVLLPLTSFAASKKDIDDAFALADKTLAYVQKAKKLDQPARDLKACKQAWTGGTIGQQDYDDFCGKVRRLRRAILLSHPDLDFEA